MKNSKDDYIQQLRKALIGARNYIARGGYSVPTYIDEALGDTLPTPATQAILPDSEPSPFIQNINSISKGAER
jgi:hypothetical protein